MKQCTCVILMLLSAGTLIRGQSLFEDLEGNSTIQWPAQNALSFNTENAEVKFNFLLSSELFVTDTTESYFGIEVGASSENGIAPLFTGGELVPSSSLELKYGIKELLFNSDSHFDWAFVSASVEYAEYELFDPAQPEGRQFSNQSSVNATLTLTHTQLVSGDILLGVSGRYKRMNNIDDLKEVKVKEETVLNEQGEGVARQIADSRSRTAWQGEYRELDRFDFNIDGIYLLDVPGYKIGLAAQGRLRKRSEEDLRINAGLGVYLVDKTDKKDAYNVLGGFVLEIQDIGDAQNAGGDIWDRLKLGFVAGYYLD